MNWGQIKTHIKDQVVNQDFSDTLMQRWQELVLSRIHRDSELRILRSITTRTPTAWPDTFAFEDIISIETPGKGQRTIRLKRAGRELLAEYKAVSSGEPEYYTLDGEFWQAYPNGLNRTYTITYQKRDFLMDADNERNQLAFFHPNLLIYGILVEAYNHMRDIDAAKAAEETFYAELARHTARDKWKAAAEAPQASGAWSWV